MEAERRRRDLREIPREGSRREFFLGWESSKRSLSGIKKSPDLLPVSSRGALDGPWDSRAEDWNLCKHFFCVEFTI